MTNQINMKMYMTIGIEGMEDQEVREVVDISPNLSLSKEENERVIQARMELAQMKMQIGLGAMLLNIPGFLEAMMDQGNE